MGNRVSLPKGYELSIKSQDLEYKVCINDEIGRGGTCIVYRGENSVLVGRETIKRTVIVKEFYPVGIDINRELPDTNLQISDAEHFKIVKEHFEDGQIKHARYYEYYRDQIVSGLYIFGNANNTVYAVSDATNGKTLSQINPKCLSLNKIASLMESICRAVYKIHRKQNLYLDCKPDNFFYNEVENGLQLDAYLFDFDTIVSAEDIKQGKYNFCSASMGWVPPEQELEVDDTGYTRYRYHKNIGYHTDIYSIGAVFFWLLTQRNPTELDLEMIQKGSFDWRNESQYCLGADADVIESIQEILQNSLDTNTERRKDCYGTYIASHTLLNQYKVLYGKTVGLTIAGDPDAHFGPIYSEIKEVKQSQQETNQSLQEIKSHLGSIAGNKSPKRVLPTSTNRFKYNSNSTHFIGRDSEMQALLNMCNAQDSFLWMGIYGQGGTGKSRLAYELCSRLIEQDWNVYAPLHYSANKEELRKEVSRPHGNILICLDYIKQDIDEIEQFITSIIENPYDSDYKIRLLLIEREKQDVLIDNANIKEYIYRTEVDAHYYDGLIELQPMEENIIRSIIDDYIYIKDQKSLAFDSPDELDIIMNTLKAVDPEGKRPLYALFIADAWLNDAELTKWDRQEALKYLLDKEQKRLSDIIENLGNNLNKVQQDKYRSVVEYLYAVATYSGGIRIDDYLDDFIQNYDEDLLLGILSEFGILSPENEIEGWEPDLIGEYFCVDYFNRLKTDDVQAFINLIIEKDISAYTRYSELIYKDYLDLIRESKWIGLMCNIRFPQEYQYVRRKEFAGSEFLHNISFGGRVVIIQSDAFRDCVNLEKIVFPASLEIIEANAFQGCTNLREAVTEDGRGKDPSIISIENFAFKDCGVLEKVILPESLQLLGISAFENCRSLTEIQIPRKINRIGNSSFAGCESLKRIVMNTCRNVTLGDSCFTGCNSLIEVKGSDNISAIENYVFKDCVKLEEISLSDKLKTFKEGVFSNCYSLKRIDLSLCNIDVLPLSSFSECTSLNSVFLPDGIKEIGNRAFNACVNLETLNIPAQLRKLGGRVFRECEKLNHLIFPESLKEIGEYAFENCVELSDIRFRAPVLKVGVNAFNGCTALYLSNIIGLMAHDTKKMCGFEFTSISDNEFEFLKSYAKQREIIIPDSVIRIGDDAFRNQESLVSITLPASVKSIGDRSFSGCVKLKTVICSNDSLTSIGSSAFKGCKALENITGSLKISKIEDSTFENCVSLKRVNFSIKVTTIGVNAFYGCSKLMINYQKQTNPPKYIGTGAFEGCQHAKYPVDLHFMWQHKLNFRQFCFDGFVFKSIRKKDLQFLKEYSSYEELNIPNTCIDIKRVQFSDLKKMKKLVIPESVKSLAPAMFKGCISLEEIELPRTIKIIPPNTFEGCKALKSIRFRGDENNRIPEGVEIDEAAFMSCSSLSSIKLSAGLSSIKRFTFCGCERLLEIEVPDSVGWIGKRAFLGCRSLKEIRLPNELQYMGKTTFYGCSSLVQVKNLENTMIKEIQNNMFESCTHLENIVLPEELQTIKGSAFKNCHRLKVPRNFLPRDLMKIEDAAFQGCFSIEALRIPRNITSIEDYTFKQCSSLSKVKFLGDVIHIGQSAFYHCNSLCSESFELPENLETMGICALSYCNSLINLTIPQTVHKLPEGLFKGCTSLKAVELPECIEEIPVDCFKNCISLKSVNISENVKLINAGAFRGCIALKPDEKLLPDELHEIREAAFRYCDSLTDVFIPQNVKKLPSAVFEGCINLKSVEFKHNILNVDNYAFANCTSLSKFPFALVDQRIGDAAFINCHELVNIEFSDTIKSISSAAFRGCSKIESIVFPDSITNISGAVLRDAINLKNVVIPESVIAIRKSAFRDCIKLEDVDVQSSYLSVGRRAFMGCSELDYIELPENSEVQSDAFEDCPAEIEFKKTN